MIPLPEKGEARRAAMAMNERMTAADPSIGLSIESLTHESVIPSVYGDLFDVEEVVGVSYTLAERFMIDIARERRSPISSLVSLYLLGVGLGCMMERERWLRQGREDAA